MRIGLLAIYLNDHLAGGTVGRELVRRALSSNQGSAYGPFLQELNTQIEEDRQSLLEIMRRLGVRVDRFKTIAAWGAEKLGRLKPNGRLVGYSPLSRVVELEALLLGVHGKLALWRSLQTVEAVHSRLPPEHLSELIARAERQIEGLESHRLSAVAEALTA